MKVRYVGPFNAVEIAAIRQRAEKGKSIEVPAEVGRELVKQSDWKKVGTPKKEKKE